MKPGTALLPAFVVALTLWPITAIAQTLTLTIENGFVTLDARAVSLRQILQRWAEVGGVVVLNAESVPTTPVTLQLSDVTERAALDTLLRSMSGYVLGPRQPGRAGAEIARIMLLPTSAGVQNSGVPVPQVSIAAAELTSESEVAAAVVEIEPNEETQPGTDVQTSSPTEGVAERSGSTASGARARSQPPELPARPDPIRYSDQLDADGNRARAPSVPVVPSSPGEQAAAALGAAPTSPFGATTATPGTIAPVPKPTKP